MPRTPSERSTVKTPHFVVKHDDVVEQVLIAAAIVSREARTALITEHKVRAEEFLHPDMRAAWFGIRKLEELNLNYDGAAMKRLVGDHADVEYLEKLASMRPAPPEDLGHYVGLLRYDGRRVAAVAPYAALGVALQDMSTPSAKMCSILKQLAAALEPPPARDDGFAFTFAGDLAKPLPAKDYLVPHFRFGPGRVILLTGYGGSGKTILIQSLALAVAAGLPEWCGLAVRKHGKVRHIDFEMGQDDLQRRYQRLARGLNIDLASLGDRLGVVSFSSVKLDSPEAESRMRAACTGATLVVIDSLAAATPSLKENDTEMPVPLDMLSKISAETGCTIVVLHHETKAPDTGRKSSLAHARGSGAIIDAAGSVVSVSPAGKGVRLTYTKASASAKSDPIRVRFEDQGDVDENGVSASLAIVEHDGSDDSSDGDEGDGDGAAAGKRNQFVEGSLVSTLEKHGTLNRSELLEKTTGCGSSAKRAALVRLEDMGTVVVETGKHGSKNYRLRKRGED